MSLCDSLLGRTRSADAIGLAAISLLVSGWFSLMTARDHLAFTAKSLPAQLHTFPADAAVIFNAQPLWVEH